MVCGLLHALVIFASLLMVNSSGFERSSSCNGRSVYAFGASVSNVPAYTIFFHNIAGFRLVGSFSKFACASLLLYSDFDISLEMFAL